MLETAGNIDLDVEIKFNIGEKEFSIDVTKSQLNELKVLYKILLKISKLQEEGVREFNHIKDALSIAEHSFGRVSINSGVVDVYKELYTFINAVLDDGYDMYIKKDYREVFEKYLNTKK